MGWKVVDVAKTDLLSRNPVMATLPAHVRQAGITIQENKWIWVSKWFHPWLVNNNLNFFAEMCLNILEAESVGPDIYFCRDLLD